MSLRQLSTPPARGARARPAAEADDVELDEHAEVHVPVSLHTAQMDSAFEGAPLYQETAKANARQASAGEKIRGGPDCLVVA